MIKDQLIKDQINRQYGKVKVVVVGSQQLPMPSVWDCKEVQQVFSKIRKPSNMNRDIFWGLQAYSSSPKILKSRKPFSDTWVPPFHLTQRGKIKTDRVATMSKEIRFAAEDQI
uniref:Uncharacterized protein n=1 Tax=Rhizophora mucronata TaxID=61149 RepID=A0A2P2INQ8_RHIMU